ncbi:Tos1p SCDLUD_001989 [Saccharomycodes ludwigii]|uniref:Tos1p n=1 Tax=Saccharomycodes ludwigii TaxID=36035 RepID=UPI001E84808E|nr:hypothetical protein SCDLUD_001989 [Saccharomycodes ludwigii]KAH3902174.1 hypothetical protein SCDLUD_001989 [Saccharomycodes ludwigii]
MKFSKNMISNLLAIAVPFFLATVVNADDCQLIDGNYYCSETEAVVFSNVGYSGSYSDVTSMDETSCACTQSEVTFSGSNSPFDQELSVHFRGPLKLVQFGVYYPASSSVSKKKREEDQTQECSTVVFHHDHGNKRDVVTDIVEVMHTVYVDGDGNLITDSTAVTTAVSTSDTTGNTVGVTTTLVQDDAVSAEEVTSADATTASTSAAITTSSSSSSASSSSASSSSISSSSISSSSASSSSTSSSDSSGSSSSWSRHSYYTPGSTDNCTFMNYYGGSGSGTWSSCFGDSISFANSDASGGASSATALEEVTISSDVEYMIFSGDACNGNDCGYYRSGIPAYHGFYGADKMFVFEFEMPHDSSSSSSTYNYDMPAIWLLNAKIPRTLQYGNSDCSCWKTGCGELDLLEILTSGSEKLIAHLHDGQGDNGGTSGGGGSQDYFVRPTSGTMKVAVIFDSSDSSIHVVQLDSSADFDSSLDASTVSSWLEQSGSTAALS